MSVKPQGPAANEDAEDTGLWWAWFEEYPEEGSTIVQAPNEDAAKSAGAVELDTDADSIAVALCDPHKLAETVWKLRAQVRWMLEVRDQVHDQAQAARHWGVVLEQVEQLVGPCDVEVGGRLEGQLIWIVRTSACVGGGVLGRGEHRLTACEAALATARELAAAREKPRL